MEISGACHCGRVRFVVELPFDGGTIPVRRCGCSFCRMHGAAYTSHPDGRLDAVVRGGSVRPYAFATGTASFHVCPDCGGIPFVTSEVDGVLRAVVNVNTFEGVDPERLVARDTDFDGEDLSGRLARRGRNWIGVVTVRREP